MTADDDGRGPVFRIDLGDGRGHARDQRRRDVHRRVGQPRRHGRVRAADVVRGARRTRCGSTWQTRSRRRPLREPGRARPELPGTLTEVETTAADGRRVRAWLALPDGADRRTGAAAAVDPRRPARLVERVVVAVEPVDPRRAGVRRAAAGPGAVDRVRPGVRAARLGRVGCRAVHGPDGDHRRGRGARRHRRDPHGRDGRLVRRLHGQLGGGAHRPVPGDRHAREPVGARPVRADDGRGVLLGARDDRRRWRWRTRRTGSSRRSSRRCSSCTATRTTGCPSARACASGTSCWPRAGCPADDEGKTPHRFLYFPDENHWVLTPAARDRLVPGGAGVPGGARARPIG